MINLSSKYQKHFADRVNAVVIKNILAFEPDGFDIKDMNPDFLFVNDNLIYYRGALIVRIVNNTIYSRM